MRILAGLPSPWKECLRYYALNTYSYKEATDVRFMGAEGSFPH